MQRDGSLLHGAAGTEVLGIGPGALGFRVADGWPPLYCLRMRLSVKRVLQTRRPVRGALIG